MAIMISEKIYREKRKHQQQEKFVGIKRKIDVAWSSTSIELSQSLKGLLSSSYINMTS